MERFYSPMGSHESVLHMAMMPVDKTKDNTLRQQNIRHKGRELCMKKIIIFLIILLNTNICGTLPKYL